MSKYITYRTSVLVNTWSCQIDVNNSAQRALADEQRAPLTTEGPFYPKGAKTQFNPETSTICIQTSF